MNKNKSQKGTDPKLVEDSSEPAYLPAEDISIPNNDKNKMKDYMLELEFTPEAETINIDAMQNLDDPEPPLASPLPKPMNPPNLSESKERSKI